MGGWSCKRDEASDGRAISREVIGVGVVATFDGGMFLYLPPSGLANPDVGRGRARSLPSQACTPGLISFKDDKVFDRASREETPVVLG